MKKIIVMFIGLLPLAVNAQDLSSSGEVIKKYLEVTKISENYKSVTDLVLNSTTESQRGVAETEVKIAFPLRVSMSIFSNGMEVMSTRYDGQTLARKSGFSGGGGGGGQGQGPRTGEEAKAEAMRLNPFMEAFYDEYGYTHKLVGTENVADKPAYVIEVTDKNGKSWKDFYDKESGLKVKTLSVNETPRGKFENTVLYEKYKALKGSPILFATVKKQVGGMGETVSELQSIKVNKGLKDKEFEIK